MPQKTKKELLKEKMLYDDRAKEAEENYYKKTPLFEIGGIIQIPLDRMEKITNLDVKQQ